LEGRAAAECPSKKISGERRGQALSDQLLVPNKVALKQQKREGKKRGSRKQPIGNGKGYKLEVLSGGKKKKGKKPG